MIDTLRLSLAAIPHLGVILAALWTLYLVLMAMWIVWEKREPAATLGWLLALAALPVLGFLVYHLVGPRRIKRQRQRRLLARAALDERPVKGGPVTGLPPCLAHLAHRTTGIPPVAMQAPRLLRDGEETYTAMLAAIAEARHHVHLASYIFDPDTTGEIFLSALLDKARAGVQVRVLIDSVGSTRLRHRFFDTLRAAGGEVDWFHPIRFRPLRRSNLNFRSHRKMLIVDGCIGFTGGVNISDTQDHRRRADAHRDLHLRFEGEAVRALQLTFLEDWAYVSGKALCDPALWPEHATQGAPTLMLPSGPDTSWESFHRLTVSLLHTASQRIWLATPYFVPTEATRLALGNAALSGVDVRIMLPQRADSLLVSAAARSYYDELLATGVRIFEYHPNLLHTKALLVDDRYLLIGSGNFDNRSFRLNFELSALIADTELASAMDALWHDYARQANEITTGMSSPRWRRWVDAAARPLSPLL